MGGNVTETTTPVEEQSSVPQPGDLTAKLAQCREKAGLDLEQAADEMHLSASLLRSLEQEDFPRLPEPPYVRGYLRGYAKFASIDAKELISTYEALRGANPDEIAHHFAPARSLSTLNQPSVSPTLVRAIIFGVIIVGLGLTFMLSGVGDWFTRTWDSISAQTAPPQVARPSPAMKTFTARKDAEEKTVTLPAPEAAATPADTTTASTPSSATPETSTASTTSSPTNAPAPTASPVSSAQDTATSAAATDSTAVNPATSPAATPATGSTTETTAPAAATTTTADATTPAATGAAATPATTPAATDAAATPATTPVATDAAATPATADASATPATTDATASKDAAATPATPPIAGEVNVKLEFSDEVWMQVKDDGKKTLFESLNSTGSTKEFKATTPINFKVGNARGVKIYLNGQLYDQAPYIKGSVARFKVE
jgi:cytoskeletal protein RodZ